MDQAAFENWYRKYPRKEHKIAAQRAWAKFNPSPATIEKMTADLDRYRGVKWEHIPHPASYINGRRWEDERPPPDRLDPRPEPHLNGQPRPLASLKAAADEDARLTPEQRATNRRRFHEIIESIGAK